MKLKHKLCGLSFLLTAMAANALPVLITGTPSNAYSVPPTTVPSPILGGPIVNFDNLTACQTYPSCSTVTSLTQGNFTFSSPDGLAVIPYSSQSAPNELWDASSDGSANLTISLNGATSALGVGIADSDDLSLYQEFGVPVNITLQALGAGDTDLGSPFIVTISESGSNPGNGYFVVQDTTSDIYGLQISAPATDESGLAIDDVQATPEPSSFTFMALGLIGLFILGAFRMVKGA
ncbi:MAG: hypothetical protein ABR956_12995 [Terracidiphilus sp.]